MARPPGAAAASSRARRWPRRSPRMNPTATSRAAAATAFETAESLIQPTLRQRRVHVRLDLGLRERAVVDAHLVDETREVVAARAPPDVRADGAVDHGRWDRPHERAVVEHAIDVDAERARRRVVNARDVV